MGEVFIFQSRMDSQELMIDLNKNNGEIISPMYVRFFIFSVILLGK